MQRSDSSWTSYLPAILAIVGAFLMLGLRLQIGERFYLRRGSDDARSGVLYLCGACST